jgi:MHS family proline/betaine transporter-like MFS transporter
MEKKSKHWQGSLKQAITASTVGNILEWYDFALYGYVAPYIGPLFFPSHDPRLRQPLQRSLFLPSDISHDQ